MNVLVLSAHPDDETIGAGGTIAKLCDSGADVTLWIATETYEPRWSAAEKQKRFKEARAAADILGIGRVLSGGFRTMHLAATPAIEISSAVRKVVIDTGAQLLLAPPPCDINSDHSALFDAALVAARGVPGNSVRAFYAYEIGTTTRYAAPGRAFEADTCVDIAATFERKIEAMAAYESEVREYPHPRSREGLDIIARERGLAAGFKYAEAFMLISRRYGGEETPLL